MHKIVRRPRRTTAYASNIFQRPRRTTAYASVFSVLLTYTKRIHSVFNVRQRIHKIFHTLGIRWLNRQGVTAALEVSCGYARHYHNVFNL